EGGSTSWPPCSRDRRRWRSIEMNQTTACTVFLLLATGCTVGPNYQRPAVDTATTYRGLTAEQAEQSEPASLADQSWWEVFQDEQLQELISIALEQNYDERIAAT